MATKTKKEELLAQLKEPDRGRVEEYCKLQNSPSLPDEKLLEPLDEHDRGLVEEYCKLQNSPSLPDEKLLEPLDEHQTRMVEEYYKLQSSPSLPDDAAEKRLCSIWEEAQTDPVLCKILELVDDLCCLSSEKVTKEDSDQRAYWEEYLVLELQTKLDQEEGRIPATALEGSTWLIKCPNGRNLSTITLPSDAPQIMQQFKDQTCGRCQTPYGTHSWEPLPEAGSYD